jgi:ferredoxin
LGYNSYKLTKQSISKRTNRAQTEDNMALLITNECIACDACREECPNEAIEENDPVYIIDSDRCTECVGHFDEPQCIAVCPVDCIISDPDNVENIEELKFKFDKLQEEE